MDVSVNTSALNSFSTDIWRSACHIAKISTWSAIPPEGRVTGGARAQTMRNTGHLEKSGNISSHRLEIYGNGMDIAEEYASIIAKHRAFDANTKVIDTYDDLMETILDLSS